MFLNTVSSTILYAPYNLVNMSVSGVYSGIQWHEHLCKTFRYTPSHGFVPPLYIHRANLGSQGPK